MRQFISREGGPRFGFLVPRLKCVTCHLPASYLDEGRPERIRDNPALEKERLATLRFPLQRAEVMTRAN